MADIINRIKQLQEEFEKLLPMQSELQTKLDNKFRLEFNYNSNHLEGNTLNHNETELLLIFGRTEGNHTKREYDEMEAHNIAFMLIKEWATDSTRPLTESDIKNLNRIILVKPFWKEAITSDGQQTSKQINIGNYKDTPNHVRLSNGEQFYFASVVDTPIMMRELIEWYRHEVQKNELEPVALAALLHYKFVRIHPFDDGNGRIARLLMNYVLYSYNLPPVVIKSAEKKDYLAALNTADVGNLNSFIEYIAYQLVWSLELSIKAAKGESIEEDDDIDKEISVWKKQQVSNLKDNLQRSEELIFKLYSNFIHEVFEQLVYKIRVFADMFHKINYETYINNYNKEGIEWLEEALARIIKHQEDSNNPQSLESTKYLLLNIYFEEYELNEKNNFSLYEQLRFEFRSYKYQVLYNHKLIIEKSYNDFLNTDEQRQIIDYCFKSVFEEIKQKSGNKS